MTTIDNKFNDLTDSNDYEISLKSIWDFFFRNKFRISLVSSIFFILAITYSFSLKKIWRGKFQIVLNSEKTLMMQQNIDPNIASALGIKEENDLNTEVGILKSPSLLLPVFQFVESSGNNLSKNKKISFSKWKKDLDINLEKGTSILNISYTDKNKKIIIPVLKKISNAYQEYSGKKKRRAIELAKDYLKKQIIISKDKSSKSLKNAQEFAIEQDLILNKSFEEKDINKISPRGEFALGSFLPNTGIENIRVNSANRIRAIDMQIKKITEIGNDIEKLQYIYSNIPALVDENLHGELVLIEKELLEKGTSYKELDQTIVRIKKRRELLINLLKKRAIGYLQAERVNAEAIMQASMRPKGILLKYKELVRQAGRDESTLISLENELELIELEEAKLEDPWELITIPTLREDPVGPHKLKIGVLGLLSGFFISSGFSLYKEKKSKKIFNISELEKLFSFKFVEEINNQDLETTSKKVLYLKEVVNKLPEKIFLFVIGDIVHENLKNLEASLKVTNKSKKAISTLSSYEKLNSISTNDSIILITSTGLAKKPDIVILKKLIDLNKLNLCGLILLND